MGSGECRGRVAATPPLNALTNPPSGTLRFYRIQAHDRLSAPALLLQEGFNAGVLPADWSISNAPGTTVGWRFDDPDSRANQTAATGLYAVANSDAGTQRRRDRLSTRRDARAMLPA